MMSTQTLNDNDFDSPGYEFLRSYQNMSRLYTKLVALNYQRDFCPLYKCPSIHKYYFSLPSKNPTEQQFIFTCLSAWLIKDKCQMNLELEPEEYQEMDHTVLIILEALRLLLTSDDQSSESMDAASNMVGFNPGRLKQGFGPEVIYTLNILTDRALELVVESGLDFTRVKVLYHDKGSNTERQQNMNSITIGQPFVGGGLTTRPLGSYKIDDRSLVLDDPDEDADTRKDGTTRTLFDLHIDEADWYQQVERAMPALESANIGESSVILENWHDYLEAAKESRETIQQFMDQFRSLLTVISTRIDRQLQVISIRERSIQTDLRDKISNFLDVWRGFSVQLAKNKNLIEMVTKKTTAFEDLSDQLNCIEMDIESRIKELNDGRKLKELEMLTKKLKAESNELNLRVGLLLTVYAKRHCTLINDQCTH